MRKTAFAGLVLFAAPALAANSATFNVLLTGPAEVPPAPVAGHGTASITIDPSKSQLCYKLSATGTDTPTMAHVHKGAAGVAGPVVVPLDPPANGSSKVCATAAADALTAILADPSAYYVNVHTAKYPRGAMRGQLGK